MIKTLKKIFGITKAEMRGEVSQEPEATLTGWGSMEVPQATKPDYNAIRPLESKVQGVAPNMAALRESRQAREAIVGPLKQELLRLRRELIMERDPKNIQAKKIRVAELEKQISGI